jgi:coiled-coil domain-containing protein 40
MCRQTATLRQIEAYNEDMKKEIAVTRRATYKAEEAVQQLEKEKLHQDRLIEKLQENLKSLHQAATLRKAQVGYCFQMFRDRAAWRVTYLFRI